MKARKPHECLNSEERISYSVYFGRERLGYFMRLDKHEFCAFDRRDRFLGSYANQAEAVAAVYLAADAD